MTSYETLKLGTCLLAFQFLSVQINSASALDCVIEPKSIINLTAVDEGKIQEIPVKRGDLVSRGDVLVRLDDEIQRIQAELAGLRAKTDTDVESNKTRLGLRQKELERANDLMSKSIISLSKLEDAEIEEELSLLALKQAHVDQEVARIEYKRASAMLERRSIRSPVSGVVMNIDANPGEYAHEQLTIMRVAVIDPLHVEVFVPVSYFSGVRKGQVFYVKPSPPLSGLYRASVTAIDRVFDTSSGTFGMRLKLSNPDGDIPAGVRCTVDMSDLKRGGYLDDFSDDRSELFRGPQSGDWSIEGGVYSGSANGVNPKISLFSAPNSRDNFVPASDWSARVEVSSSATAGFVFQAQGEKRYRFIVVDGKTKEVKFGEVTKASSWKIHDKVPHKGLKKAYLLEVQFEGKKANVSLNGKLVKSFLGVVPVKGSTAGLLVKGGAAQFDNLELSISSSSIIGSTPGITQRPRTGSRTPPPLEDFSEEEIKSLVDRTDP